MGIVRKLTPGFIRRSFAIKFGIALLIIGLSVGAAGYAGSELVKDEFHNQVNEQYSNLAASDADGVRTWVEDDAKETMQISRLLEDKTDEEAQQWLQNEKDNNDDWPGEVVVHYVDLTNEEIVATTDGSRSAYVDASSGDTQSLTELNETVAGDLQNLDDGVAVEQTNPYTSSEGGGDFEGVHIAYLAPVDSPDGAGDRAVVYAVSTKAYAGGTLGGGLDSGVAMVVDGDNRILMEGYGSNIHDELRTYDQSDEPITDARDDGRVGMSSTTTASGVLEGSEWGKDGAYDLSGREYVVGAARIDSVTLSGQDSIDLDWVALVHTNKNVAYGDVESVSNQSLIATFVGVLLIGVFGAVLGRNTAKSIDKLKGKAQEMEEGNLDVNLHSPRDDQIGRLYEGFANMRDALKQQIREAEQARKEAEVSRAEAMEMSNYLQGKADEYAEIMQQCAAGDLTQRMEPDGENEAMDRIAGEFNEMIDELEKTTGQLKSFADEVETAGEVVQNSSESVRDASEQVADSIQQISDDAYDQKERLQAISDTMDEIAHDLETFAAETDVDFGESLDRIEEMATTLNDVVELSEQTMAESENVAGAAEEQAAELNEVTQRAEDLSRYARPLREVLDRFQTESEHEFYFPTGPGSSEPGVADED
ncbi:MAG: HAMP domain-containing protein [Halapricum sp.]